jgi:hypothetical protein
VEKMMSILKALLLHDLIVGNEMFANMTNDKLRKRLKTRGKPVSGSKSVLIGRLRGNRSAPTKKKKKKKSAKKKVAKKKSAKKINRPRSPKGIFNSECAVSHLAKYHKKSRRSPPFTANECRGSWKLGNNGNAWKSLPSKNGVWRWIEESDTNAM